MSHLDKYIKDERRGAREYDKLARQADKAEDAFERMAKDERRHASTMVKMDMAPVDVPSQYKKLIKR